MRVHAIACMYYDQVGLPETSTEVHLAEFESGPQSLEKFFFCSPSFEALTSTWRPTQNSFFFG